MESDRPRGINIEAKEGAKEMIYHKGRTMLPIVITSLCLTLLALSMLLWIPASVSYKNITSLSELNPDKVRFYTESQQIHLIYENGGIQDTIRSISDYAYSLKKENLREESIRAAEYIASQETISQDEEVPASSFQKISDPQSSQFPLGHEETRPHLSPLAEGSSRGGLISESNMVIEPDQKPTFPKGERGLEVYLARNKRTPFPAKTEGIAGIVELRFLVNTDGSLSDIRILKGLGYGCDEEALRLVENMPAWTPAIKNNHPVSYYESLSIRF